MAEVPGALDKSLQTPENRRIRLKSADRDIPMSILNREIVRPHGIMSPPFRGRRSVIFVILPLAIVVAGGSDGAVDCSDRFTVGAYGVPADDPTVRSGGLAVKGFTPIYLDKRSLQAADPETCRYVTTYDVFRLVYV